jgi:hypothetical protein
MWYQVCLSDGDMHAARRIWSAIVASIVLLFAAQAFAVPPPPRSAQVLRGDPHPNIAGARRGVRYESLTAGKPVTKQTLFGGDTRPQGHEIRQGSMGDCYLLSTAAAYAQFHPRVIQGVFMTKGGDLRVSPGGRPAARFFVKDQGTRTFKAADLATYDGRAPVNKDGDHVFNKIVENKIWGPMLEYSYTKFRNQQGGAARSDNPDDDRTGFNRTGNGGYANHVMQALTGKDAELLTVHPRDADAIWTRLKDAQEKNQVVVAGSTTAQQLRTRVREEIARGALDKRSRAARFDDSKRWVRGHAYSVWGDKAHPFLIERDGVKYVRLRNPWGTTAPGGEGEDGVGEIPFDTFLLRFDQMYIGAGSAITER